MWEEGVGVMEKKGLPRQSSTPAKPNGSFERKSDPNSLNKRNGRRRENGRGQQPEFSNRKPVPQKNRSTLDKRPRQRGGVNYRQREEVAGPEGECDFPQHGLAKNGNLNHLLNFQFAPREPVVGSTRRPGARRPPRATYNKERYLQANCQFVVKDAGDYSVQATDPDALVSWDMVEQVRTFSHEQASCPICLQYPQAGKMTKCGHVYCWACILHYLSLEDRSWRKCPICYEAIHHTDLRSVKVVERPEAVVGEVITLQLMKRERNSTYVAPLADWQDRHGRPQNMHDEVNTDFAKILVASVHQIQTSVIDVERVELRAHMSDAEPSEVCFIESAMVALGEREAALQGKVRAAEANAAARNRLQGPGAEQPKGDNAQRRKSEADLAAALSRPLPKHQSFDGSKILRQYADAFDEIEDEEEEEEEEIVVSEEDNVDDNDNEDEEREWSPSPVSDPGAEGAARPRQPSSSDHDDGASAAAEAKDGKDGSALPPGREAGEATTVEGAVAMTVEGAVALPDTNGHQERRAHRNVAKQDFYFYQASDGQQVFLHAVNARCLDAQYGGLEHAPRTITAKIIDKEIAFMTQELRRRLRYVSHLPLTCEFQVVEVRLEPPAVSRDTLQRFAGELRQRAQNRQKVRRADKRQAHKNSLEERRSYGLFPDLQLSLDSPDHFPAALDTEERRRQSSLSDASLASPPLSANMELNANAAEFVPGGPWAASQEQTGRGESVQPIVHAQTQPLSAPVSFAAKLKAAPVAAWGPPPRHGAPAPLVPGAPAPPRGRPDSDESDNEDRVPVPAFQHSFSDALTTALTSLTTNGDAEDKKAGGGSKKKKKEKKLLFSTSMMRR